MRATTMMKIKAAKYHISVTGRPVNLSCGRPGTCTQDTIHLQYITITQGVGMTNASPSTRVRLRQTKSQRSKSIESRDAVSAAADGETAGPRHGRKRGSRQQAGNIPGPLPIRHALGPDQRFRGDVSRGDELPELGLWIGPVLLSLERKKPGSVGHLIPCRLGAGGRAHDRQR